MRHLARKPLLPICLSLAAALLMPCSAFAQEEVCTTQSAQTPAERNAIADASRSIAMAVVSNDAAALRTSSAPELSKDFGALQYLVATTSPRLAGSLPVVDQVYVLDATRLKPVADGSPAEAQFFCSLNRTSNETEFDIPSLPPGRYAFAIVNLTPAPGSSAAWRLSLLLRQQPPPSGPWLLAGLYPRALTSAGHDGLWYWIEARQKVREKQSLDAWLFYQHAQRLLQPVDFVVSTHLDKLRTEASSAAPPALTDGVTPESPLVIKGANGAEFHFTTLSAEDASVATGLPASASLLDVAAHFTADPLADPGAARQRNLAAAAALAAAYPELRRAFHGFAVYADVKGQPSFSTEFPMADVR